MGFRVPSFIATLMTFWAAWFTLVALGNIADGLKSLGLLPGGWRFASGNFEAIEKVTAIYSVPRAVNVVLFVAAIVLELAIAQLCWRSLGRRDPKVREMALTLAIVLFGGFLLADELFVAWPTGLGVTHFGILVALVVTWIAARSS